MDLKHVNRLDQLIKVATCVPKVGSGRLAASIWIKNELVSIGVNQKKTHPLQKKYGDNPHRQFLHAEIDAIVKGCRARRGDLSGCYMYVARAKEDDNGAFVRGMAKSCAGCYDCAENFGIRGIYYTTYDGAEFVECR